MSSVELNLLADLSRLIVTAASQVTVTAQRTTAVTVTVTVTVTADSRQQQNFLNNRQQTTVTVWSDDV